jgi:hypothetical protein
MTSKNAGLLIPEALTINDITRHDKRQGTFAVGHDGRFGPPVAGAFSEHYQGAEIRSRRWTPTRVEGSTGSMNVMSVGEMESRLVPEFLRDEILIDLNQPVSEMITTSQGAMDLLEKVRIDIQVGLADVPLLYQPLYERVNGPFPGGAVQIGGDVLFDANVVFFQKFEAGEIVFGTLARSGAPSFVPINTYAAGFEWTEDMIEFDRSYEIGMNSRAFGRSFNYLLNHMHLSPILAYTYTASNQTAANAQAGEGITPHTLRTFQAAYRKGALAAIQRTPTWILANEADRFQIEDALLTPVIDANGNQLRRVPVEGIIYYNGATVNNGVKSYVYPGVTAGKCYYIAPRLRMRELVHHDLRVDIGPADISRLIEGQQVARARRGLYLDIANSVEEVTLPTS